ncbi:restriction endonuclease subunit S [Sphingobacterium multivorum]|uniref:restriction endonuclease subunit S n=1 Tax=Sphingobacterium multivorum TaxID=28454 RepID=UPI0028A26DF0|nr:restriction endonuclease subunit S [Sphingobacterium multivorum]
MAKYRFEDIAINSTEKKKPVEEDKYTYLGLEHLDSCNLTVSRFGSDVAPIGEKLIMKKGDVLFGKRRAYQKKVAIAPFDGIFSAHGMVLRPREDVIYKDFFPLFISSDYFLDEAIKISVGSLSPTINWGTLKNLEFDLPDMREQKRLAELLWAANDTKEAYKKLLALTDDLVKAQFIEMFGDPVMNTKGWPLDVLKNHLNVIGGYAFRSDGFEKSGIPVLKIGNINSGFFKDTNLVFWPDDKNLERYKIYPGDLVISLTGTAGKDDYGNICVLGTEYDCYYLNQRNAKLDLHETLGRSYIAWLLKVPEIKQHLTGINRGIRQANISNSDIQNLKVPIPPIELQNQFSDFVNQVAKSTLELQQTKSNLENTIKSLMKQYVG